MGCYHINLWFASTIPPQWQKPKAKKPKFTDNYENQPPNDSMSSGDESTEFGQGLPKLLKDHGIQSTIIYPGEYFYRHMQNTNHYVCLTYGGFSQLQIQEMRKLGVSDELINEIISFCQDCHGPMKRKRDDWTWKKFYCGCHVELMTKGMYF